MKKIINIIMILLILSLLFSTNAIAESNINVLDNENKDGKAIISDSKQVIKNGVYTISSAIDKNKVFDIYGDSKETRANVDLWTTNNGDNQKFKITYLEDGYYTIEAVSSGMSLDVENAGTYNGANIQQYTTNGTDAQKWIIQKTSDNKYYSISSKCNGLYIDLSGGLATDGTNIQMYNGNGTMAQKFIFTEIITETQDPDEPVQPSEPDKPVETEKSEKIIESGIYSISSSLNKNKMFDIYGNSNKARANVDLWESNKGDNQKFKVTYSELDGYYTIEAVNSGMSLDVENAGKANRTNIQQNTSNGSDTQKWIIQQSLDGYFNIISKWNGLYIDLNNGSTENGTNVQLYEGNGTMAQKFIFTKFNVEVKEQIIENGTYKICSAINKNKVFDIEGNSEESGANLELWENNRGDNQRFNVTYNSSEDYYLIEAVHSGKSLDVENAGIYNGSNIQQYTTNNTQAQKWIIKETKDGYYNIISKCNNLYVDLAGGLTNNRTNIQMYNGNGTNAQKFIFNRVGVEELKYTEGVYGKTGLKEANKGGSDLKYLKFGKGENVFFATFALHGYEDNWAKDGQELITIANDFYNKLIEDEDYELAQNWTIYVLPGINLDGISDGWTNDGPGRTTVYSAAENNKGIDLNRCWIVGDWTTSFNSNDRNYIGTEAFQAYEAQYLKKFLLANKSKTGQTVLVDLHGWTQQVIGDEGICSYYEKQFPENDKSSLGRYGTGYLIGWARSTLGSNGNVARSALIELPTNTHSHQDVIDKNYSNRYITATLEMLKSIK